jgi:3-phosphoshikimate 1-carboxyvinyltransferase
VIAPPDQRCVSCGQALDTLPLIVCGKERLRAIDYTSPEASAQVKSAVLLAGLHAEGTTSVTEPYKSRDHTELLLPAFGAAVEVDGLTVRIQGGQQLWATDCAVPGDPSSAAFLLVAAALIPGSEVACTEVLLNPTRTGFLAVMQRMGATLSLSATTHSGLGAEQVGSVTCTYSPALRATTIEAQEIPTLIDEIPILALLASAASGTTVFRQVGELRIKESDRLAAIIEGLDTLGCRAYADGNDLFVVGSAALAGGASQVGGASQIGSAALPERKVLLQDGRTKGVHPLLQTRGDHRLAMTWAVAARAFDLDLEIQGIESAAVSYPNFLEDLKGLS